MSSVVFMARTVIRKVRCARTPGVDVVNPAGSSGAVSQVALSVCEPSQSGAATPTEGAKPLMQFIKSRVGAVLVGAGVLAVLSGVGGAVASSQIGSHDIADDSIRSVDIHDGGIHGKDLSAHLF